MPLSLQFSASGEVDIDFKESHLVHPGTTQKAKKIHKLYYGLKHTKSSAIQENVFLLLNLGHLEIAK